MAKFDKNTWQTPRPLFQTLNNVYPMTVDTAASALNALLPVFITKEMDSLALPWRMFAPAGSYVWNNPPYNNISPWVIKAASEHENSILVLCNPEHKAG